MVCSHCKQDKNRLDFYKRSNRNGFLPHCKECHNKKTIERQRAFKQKCIDYKGGKCSMCGYDKYNGALEFHHSDPKSKDFPIASSRLSRFSKKIEKELDKCVLLCSNCHREEHARIKGIL